MAKVKEQKPKTETEEVAAGYNSQDVLKSLLKEHKEDHFNFEESVFYRVSTGSLKLDIVTGGGIGPGVVRFSGASELGKSAETLEIMRNFLATIPNSKGFYIKAEGRLGPDMQARSGVKFVFDAKEWVNGTCFVLESNVFETVFAMIHHLIKDNPTKNRYMFVIDSVDGLELKEDQKKGFQDAIKVAGGALISSVFLKRIAIRMTKFGHICALLSQRRQKIKINQYEKDAPKMTDSAGGNAMEHYSDWIFEFQPRYNKDLIAKNEKENPNTETNPIVGHWARITFRKTPNEQTHNTYKYPIKYGRTGGKSIWLERELVDIMLSNDRIKQKGAWFEFVDGFHKQLVDAGFEVPKQVQGLDSIFKLLDSNQELTKFIFTKLKDILTPETVAVEVEDEDAK